MTRGGLVGSSWVEESFEMTFVAFAEIWVLDWIERRVMVWVCERVVSSKAIFVLVEVVGWLVIWVVIPHFTVTCCVVS
jgi:hypothetical protein